MSARSEVRKAAAAPPAGAIPGEIFDALRELVEKESGIVLGPGNQAQIREVLRERMRALALSDPYEYVLRVLDPAKGIAERGKLVTGLTVGETGFFRTPEHFLALRDRILPGYIAAGARLPLRIWSAGCSTGEEPYSIAIAAVEAFRGRFLRPVSVLATDIRPEFLETARQGIYPLAALRHLPFPHYMEYFRPLDETRVRVSDEVRALVTFEEGNLARFAVGPEAAGPFNIVFCRNVMIYFRPETTRRIVAKIHKSLVEGGVLFLGHSETMWGISNDFRLERHGGGFYYRKGGPPDGRERAAGAPAAAPCGNGGGRKGASPAMERAREAESLADRGRIEDAERACREALALDPSCVEASYLLAVLLRREAFVEDALLCAERALSADPAFVMAMVEAAECLALLDRKDDAAARWREAYRMLGEETVRFPRLSPSSALSAKTVREYVKSHLVR